MSLQPAFFLKKTPPSHVVNIDELRAWVIAERYASLWRWHRIWVGIGCVILAVLIFYLLPKAIEARELEQDGIVTLAAITRYELVSSRSPVVEYTFTDKLGKVYSGSGGVSWEMYWQIEQAQLQTIEVRYLASKPTFNELTTNTSHFRVIKSFVMIAVIGVMVCFAGWHYYTFWLFPKFYDEKKTMQLLEGTILACDGKTIIYWKLIRFQVTVSFKFTSLETGQLCQGKDSWVRNDLQGMKARRLVGSEAKAVAQEAMYPPVGSLVYVKYIDDGNFELL